MQRFPDVTGLTGAGSTVGESAAGESSAAPEQLISSERVQGTSVRRSTGDTIGAIEHLMIDKRSGKVVYAVMSFGGFLGLGERFYPIPWSLLHYNDGFDAYEVNISDEQLRNAPSVAETDRITDRDWNRDIHDYYGVIPYWGV